MGSTTTYYHLYVTDDADYVDPVLDWSQNFIALDEIVYTNSLNTVHLDGNQTITGIKTFAANQIFVDGANLVFGSSTGSQIGTDAGQLIGFFGAIPSTQIAGNSDVLAGLVTLGLRAASSNPPLNIGTGILTAGPTSVTTLATSGNITLGDGNNIVLGTSIGTKIGFNTTQKLSFYGVTPIVQVGGSSDVLQGLVNVGLRATSSNPPLNLGTGVLTAGATSVTTLNTSGNVTLSDGNNIVLGTSTGTKIGTATTQKVGFFNATPVVQITGATDVLAGLVSLGLRAASSNPPLNLGTGALTAGASALGITTVTGTGSSTALTIVPPTAPTGSASAFIGSVAGGGVTVAFTTTPQTGTYSGWKKSQNTLTNPSSGVIPDAIGTWFAGGPIASTNVTTSRNYGTYIGSTLPASGTGVYGLAISNDFSTASLWVSANNDSTTSAAGVLFGLSKDVQIYRSASAALTIGAASGVTLNGALSMGSHLINNVTDPVSAQDAATKNYVGITTQINSPAFGYAGVIATSTGQARFYVNDSVTVTAVRASVGTAPTGATLICDVNKNGTTIYTTQANRPTIAISGNTATANSPDVTTAIAGDYFTVDVDQVGSTIAGSDLTVQIYFKKT